ncbi:ABC transporter substrate-binding protein [Nonomuraea sp. NPDC050478]|uniref:ABC transporter substrate-binding protein n=1 Tax=Nonomuraea sp. NPDC050478 TaxID=3364365 RepID=UPI0037AF8E20
MKFDSASEGRPRPRRWRLAAAALVPLLLAACGGNGQSSGDAASEPYHLGVLVDLTGSYAALGEAEKTATEAFAKKVNAEGGINGRRLKLTVVDGRSSESDAVSGVRKLHSEGALAVIGPSGTSASIAIKPITASLKIPAIGMASGTAIVEPIEEAKWMFKNFPDITRSTRAMLSFAKGLGAKSVSVLAPNNAYGQQQSKAVPELAKEYGLTVAGSELHDPDATDFVPQLTRLKGATPDSVIVYGVVPGSAVIGQNAKQIGFDAEFIYEPGSASPDFIKVGQDAVEGRYVVGTKALVADSIAEDDPQYQAVKDFVAAYGAEPTQFAGNGWDAITMFTEAIKKADPDLSDLDAARTAIRDALENQLGGTAAVNGIYRYSPTDHSGLGSEGLALLQVKDGAFRYAGGLTETGEVVLDQE